MLGKRVAALRRARGWSAYRLARQAGLSESYVGQIERGRHDPSLTTLLKLTRGFGLCSVDELLSGREFGTGDYLQAIEPRRLEGDRGTRSRDLPGREPAEDGPPGPPAGRAPLIL